jgi:hypothetical protein
MGPNFQLFVYSCVNYTHKHANIEISGLQLPKNVAMLFGDDDGEGDGNGDGDGSGGGGEAADLEGAAELGALTL